MKRLLIVAFVLVSGCALRGDARSACSDPLGLYVDARYERCCKAHDDAYEIGGYEIDRLVADRELYLCAIEEGSEDDAASMFAAVRLGGSSRFNYWKD